MLDIRFIRENQDIVQKNAENRGYRDVSIAKLLELDGQKRILQQEVDELRERRNQNSAKMKGGKPEQELIDEGKRIKVELSTREEYLTGVSAEFQVMIEGVPNMAFDDVPVGGEEASIEIKQFGEQDTGAVDHLDYATARDWLDFERGAKVAGAKFYYLKGDLALLEQAVTQYAIQFVTERNFTLMSVPHMVNQRTMTGTGFAPRSSDQSDEYSIEGEDLSLIATAEIPLTGYHADEIIDEADLPLRYAGISPCYRREAGAAGKFTRGLFRVHQFNKLEMYVFATPESSAAIHEELLQIEEGIWQSMEIPYHVINIATGDLGAPAAKKYDLEYWSPVDGMYRELTSCSNCTDFQARNLNIRVRRADGKVEMLHTLNGTAVSLARSLVAILEHCQTEDGKIRVPEVLRPYIGGREVL
ncbi:MAG: serine--tRNA ligase [Candidatus Saccharimonas sp.]